MRDLRAVWSGLGVAVLALALGACPPTNGIGRARDGSALVTPRAPRDPHRFEREVTLHLVPLRAGTHPIRFGLPLLPHAVSRAANVGVYVAGARVPARVEEILAEHDATGAPSGVRAVVVELAPRALSPSGLDVRVVFQDPTPSAGEPPPRGSFAASSEDSPERVVTTLRSITQSGGDAELVEGPKSVKTLFVGREPRVLASYPAGYLAATGILGAQVPADEVVARAGAGLQYLSDAAIAFGRSALYLEPYALNPDPDSVPDPKTNFEGWLYDRCATLLLLYVHAGDQSFLRAGLRSCSYYSSQIRLSGPDAGTFAGKPDADPKYSHLRGLYAYYALTGDEGAFAAGRAIADMWQKDEIFVGPYREGHTRGKERLWTERLLGTSLEGLYYGYRLSGERSFLDSFKQLFDTAYRHITGDAATLEKINPGVQLPPQNCFIHSAAQQGEGNDDEPWCSGWMSDLLIDPLLRYQEQTGDARVDEVFIRLGRFLRDVGSAYFHNDVLDDHFLSPSFCDDPNDLPDRRRLVPIYGSGIGMNGKRKMSAEYSDSLHCPDATALTAAALRALKRQGGYDRHPLGPFASEGESLLQLHHEFSFCAEHAFSDQTRLGRDPRAFKPDELAEGLADPDKFIRERKLGYPSHNASPQRMLSWWFNSSLEQFGLLESAGLRVERLEPGKIPGPPCPR